MAGKTLLYSTFQTVRTRLLASLAVCLLRSEALLSTEYRCQPHGFAGLRSSTERVI